MGFFRPPIGYIVEGRGEYHCYPSLFSKLDTNWEGFIPKIKTRGNGDIVSNLDEHLRHLAKHYYPITVLICIDLREAVRSHRFKDCIDLREYLEKKI